MWGDRLVEPDSGPNIGIEVDIADLSLVMASIEAAAAKSLPRADRPYYTAQLARSLASLPEDIREVQGVRRPRGEPA